MPTAYGYVRVSHAASFAKDSSLPAQRRRIERYYKGTLEGAIDWGDIRDDAANVSAYRVPFAERPAGESLLRDMERGDHLIVDRVDRLWRNVADFVSLTDILDERGIQLHIVSFLGSPLITSSAQGKHMLNMLVMLAQLESDIKSERIRESRQSKRRDIPFGTQRSDVPGVLEWNKGERKLMSFIVEIKDDKGINWPECYDLAELYWAKLEGRPAREDATADAEFFQQLYKYETAYRYLEIDSPHQIPKRAAIVEAARQYRRERTESRISQNHQYRSAIAPVSKEELLSWK